MSTLKAITFPLLVAFVVALASCGGSDETVIPENPEPLPENGAVQTLEQSGETDGQE